MPTVAGHAGGYDAVDGRVDVWQRPAVDRVAGIAGQRCGLGTATTHRAIGQRGQRSGDNGARSPGGAVAGSPGSLAAVARGGSAGEGSRGLDAGGTGAKVSPSG